MNKEWSKEVFARNLEWYMKVAGKNQKEMAAIIGVSAPTFNEWLKAKKYPRIDKIEKLAHYFGILKSDLIEDKGEEHKEMQKNNDALADIVVKLRTDEKFLSVVSSIYKLDNAELQKVESILALLK